MELCLDVSVPETLNDHRRKIRCYLSMPGQMYGIESLTDAITRHNQAHIHTPTKQYGIYKKSNFECVILGK